MDLTPGSATTLRRVWPILREETHEMAEKEPFLAPMLNSILLSSPSLSHALAQRLSLALASAEVSKGACQSLLSEVLDRNPSIVKAAAQDLIAVRTKDPACRTHIHAFLHYKAFHAVQTHRIANALWTAGRQELAAWLSNRVSVALGPDIHPAASLGAGIILDHGSGIVIGETAVVEDDVTLLQNVTLGGTGKVVGDRHPKVRKGAMIGAGASIIGNVEIGAFSKVGAGSVVLKDVPPACTVAGVPAQIVRLHRTADYRGNDPEPIFC
ncbi:serine O-acetyltransferase [Roseovarius aestuariivivens]|uniref:serine O-acetyltransferase n=1 Tax=Roseovarius aestuariivivens TaxID=1888910 RepID=UPI00107FFC3B|nr:serine O-acetyltransferase [Roseovarius aestuariivivens]